MPKSAKKRHTEQRGVSGLLFTDLVHAGVEEDKVGTADSYSSLADSAPVSNTAAQYPEQIERFLRLQKLAVNQTAIRPTDIVIADALTPFAKMKNDQRIYRALWDLARERGQQITDSVWRIQIGYAVLARISHCSKRALGRAFLRLETLHYLLRYPVAHDGTIATTYWVRSPEACVAMLVVSGCTHVRILRGKARQLCCSASVKP